MELEERMIRFPAQNSSKWADDPPAERAVRLKTGG
jgi:hypothetical protein